MGSDFSKTDTKVSSEELSSENPPVVVANKHKVECDSTSIPKSTMSSGSKKQLSDWSVEDVSDWLDSLHLSKYKDDFSNVNGIDLVDIVDGVGGIPGEAQLSYFGVHSTTDAVKMAKHLREHVSIQSKQSKNDSIVKSEYSPQTSTRIDNVLSNNPEYFNTQNKTASKNAALASYTSAHAALEASTLALVAYWSMLDSEKVAQWVKNIPDKNYDTQSQLLQTVSISGSDILQIILPDKHELRVCDKLCWATNNAKEMRGEKCVEIARALCELFPSEVLEHSLQIQTFIKKLAK